MIVVTDAGPLIYLAGAGELALLRALFTLVVVPRVVYEEVTVAGAGRLGATAVADAAWLVVEDQEPDPALLRSLDAGESAAIPLAARLGASLLADDAGARAAATERRIPVVGTLGVLLLAKRGGHIDKVAPVVARVTALGLYVTPDLLARVLRAAGE